VFVVVVGPVSVGVFNILVHKLIAGKPVALLVCTTRRDKARTVVE